MEKIKVLLVEDEPTLAMIIKDTLDGNEFDNQFLSGIIDNHVF